jgi:hypothetical protein
MDSTDAVWRGKSEPTDDSATVLNHDNDNRKSEYFHHFSFNFCVPPPSRDVIRVNNAAFAIDCLPIPYSGIPNLDVICKACRLGEVIFYQNMV